MAALGARLAAEWHRAAQEEEVRRTAEEKKVRESLLREVRETIRSQFFERDVLVETVAARVNAEMDYQVKVATNYINAHIGAQMDGVRDYVDQLKEHLEECLANEMRTGGE
jgi:CHASE3 domain sensor protein